MIIRNTTIDDLDEVCLIYEDARRFMIESGNPDQWGEVHPARELVDGDIRAGKSYVCADDDDEILAVFYYNIEQEPTYSKIDGRWLNDMPYGIVHRIASKRGSRGAGLFCLDWCFEQCRNVRIDTHADNVPMRGLLDKLGYTYCGTIWILNGDERMAYQKSE